MTFIVDFLKFIKIEIALNHADCLELFLKKLN